MNYANKTICINSFIWLRFAQQNCVAVNDNSPSTPTPIEMKLSA